VRYLGAILALACFCSSASAEFKGNDLKQYCSFYPRHTESTAMCTGYIAGTLDMVRGVNQTFKSNSACEPSGVTGEQLIEMSIKYLNEHPEQLHRVAAGLIWNMYVKAFPCKTSN